MTAADMELQSAAAAIKAGKVFEYITQDCPVLHDHNWWAREATKLGTDWVGIAALRQQIIKELEAAAMKRPAGGHLSGMAA